MLRDHYVNYRSEESIAKIAGSLRNTHDSLKNLGFDVTDFIDKTLPYYLNKAGLKIELFDKDFADDEPAHVSFNPLTLHVDRKVWTDAKIGEGYARFIVAHEIGHILLHDTRQRHSQKIKLLK
jgi:hypothetical protein